MGGEENDGDNDSNNEEADDRDNDNVFFGEKLFWWLGEYLL